MTPEPIDLHIANISIAVTAILAVSGVVLKQRKDLKADMQARAVDEERSRAAMTALQKDISSIMREIHPNGGSSLKDQVTNMARDIDDLKQTQRDLTNFLLTEARPRGR